MPIVEFGEFKGNKMIILKRDEDDRYPFQFGLNKAKLAVACIEDIKKFVADNDKPKETAGQESDEPQAG